MKGRPERVRRKFFERLATGDTLFVSAIVLFELWYGIAKSVRQADNIEQLASFLSGGVSIVSFERDDAPIAGHIRASLQARGTPIGPYDILIAAQALRRGAVLVTANAREFARIDGLACEDWTAR